MSSVSVSLPFQSAILVDQNCVSDHSRALASKLSSHMGMRGALQISAENQWDGVVAALLEIKNKVPAQTDS